MWLSQLLVVLIVVALCSPAEAQQPKKLHRIGYLSALSPSSESIRSEAIRRALHELGYVEGQNIAIEYRYSDGKPDRAPELAAELVRLKVDVIVVAGGDVWTRAAKNATKTIPIVMAGVGMDPVVAGLVASLARPGGNVTGLTMLNTGELGGKRLELLKEAAPKVASVAVLYEPAAPGSAREVKEDLPATAHALGLTLQPLEVRGADGFDKVFAALNKQRPDGLYVTTGPRVFANRKRILDLAARSRLPWWSVGRQFLNAAGSGPYGRDFGEVTEACHYTLTKISKVP